MKTIKTIHWISLAIGLFVLFDRIFFGRNYPTLLLFGLPISTFSISVVCGLAMIWNHRNEDIFLPPLEYLTYSLSVLGWSWIIMALAQGDADMGNVTYWMGLTLPWLMFIGPWLAFRRHRPYPLIIDSGLVTLIAVLAFAQVPPTNSLPGVIWLVSEGYVVMPIQIGLTTVVLHLLKKTRIPNLCGAIAYAIGQLIIFFIFFGIY